jgi:hypothetical protein
MVGRTPVGYELRAFSASGAVDASIGDNGARACQLFGATRLSIS